MLFSPANNLPYEVSNEARRSEMTSFLSTLFRPFDLVEIRAIETWTGGGKKLSRPVGRYWLSPNEITGRLGEIFELNQTANIFFGVNPRIDARGTKDSVAESRFIWADLDNVSCAEAADRFEQIGMCPTITVDSGHGIHAYWRLQDPVSVQDVDSRTRFETLVKNFSAELGGDATHDCSRLLRLPTTMNVKERRNGAAPVPCQLVSLDEARIYPISAFGKWESTGQGEVLSAADLPQRMGSTWASCSSASHGTARDNRRIQGLLRLLDDDVPDRSRRDFFIVCRLSELGVSPSEMWPLVKDKSKFLDAGEPYFQRTVENALRRVGR